MAVVPMLVLSPKQIAFAGPVPATGNGLTVMVTLLLFVQEVVPTDSVKVYMVVIVGDTVGFDEVEVNPEGFDTQL